MTWTQEDFKPLLEVIKLSEDGGRFFFRIEDDLESFRVFVDCSDLFHWACADAIEIEPGDLVNIKIAAFDLGDEDHWATDLFCCRHRGMRPQGPWYGYMVWDPETQGYTDKIRRPFVPRAVEALFDACGPEREDAPKSERPADGRRWDYGGPTYAGKVPEDFVAQFKEGGQFGP